MEFEIWTRVAYFAAAILFLLSLKGLATQETARRGNVFGIVGMLIALVAVFASVLVRGEGEIEALTAPAGGPTLVALIGVVAVGALVGLVVASRVEMTSMPQLVAILHSFVGLAAVFVGLGNAFAEGVEHDVVHSVETSLGVFIGGLTFTGSVVAFGKLQGVIGSKPLILSGRHALNLGVVVGSVVLTVLYVQEPVSSAAWTLGGITLLSFVLGAHLVYAIGGADMPVVVSLLNSYSGWAAASAGFLLSNDLLIVTGALVGSSGAILSIIMCRAMNRSILNVVFGGWGASEGATVVSEDGEKREVHATSASDAANLLECARSVVIVPGYGMAVAQAQHPVREMTELLREKGIQVRYAIHPVAGRLPGHMNVLLAEADVPYDIVLEMDEINKDFGETDVVLVVGANDIVNPSALTDPGSPIAGMPVLEAWKAGRVLVLKRGMAAGYAGVENPLFFHENTRMVFGDAKATITDIVTALRAA